jgi:hypothetical protein
MDLVNNLEMRMDMSYKVGGSVVNDQCVAFVDKKFQLGSIGKVISDELKGNQEFYKTLLYSPSMANVCKNYPRLSVHDKSMVWVSLLLIMAHYESSCNTKAKAKGPNGTAIGYYQLHKGKEEQYDGAFKTCTKAAGGDGAKSSRCALGMLTRQLQLHGAIFSKNSYWEVLRPRGRSKKAGKIQSTIQNLSLCKPPAVI